MTTIKLNGREYNFERVNNDVNGNPRYVIHFTAFLRDEEREVMNIEKAYVIGSNRAKSIGGKAYKGKEYGGGIILLSYNLQDTAKMIEETLYTLPVPVSPKRQAVINDIYTDIMEKMEDFGGLSGLLNELKRYRNEFPRERDYNYYKYGNLLISYYNIRALLNRSGYKAERLSDDSVERLYMGVVKEVINEILNIYE